MPTITVQVDGRDEPYELELSLGSLTLREAARLQTQLGNRRFDLMMQTGAIELRPDAIGAFIYAKLATHLPDVTPDGFDLDMGALIEALAEPEDEAPKASDSE